MRLFLTFLGFVFICFSAGPASGQDVEDEAVAHFEAGAELYFNEAYEEAIEEFMAGHRISPNAMFLYNASLAHVKLGNLDDALEAARAARGLAGLDPTTQIQNEGRIAALELLETTRDLSQPPQVEVAEKVVMIPRAAPSTSTFTTLGYTGIAVSLVGVGLLTAMGVVELLLNDKWSEYEAAAQFGNESQYLGLRSEIKDLQTLGIVFLATGASATAVGLTFIIIDLASDRESDVTAYIAPTSDSAVFGIGGRF